MFDRFTDRARKCMGLARQEAQRFQHDYIGPEHILLGIADEGEGVGSSCLKNLDLDLAAIRAAVESRMKPGETMVTLGQIPFTPRAKRVLELSLEEASLLGHTYIGTEHLTLGLLREQESIAAQVLRELGAGTEELRAEIMELLGVDEDAEPQEAVSDPDTLEHRIDELEATLRTALIEVQRLRELL